jgi:hypothetical protein
MPAGRKQPAILPLPAKRVGILRSADLWESVWVGRRPTTTQNDKVHRENLA